MPVFGSVAAVASQPDPVLLQALGQSAPQRVDLTRGTERVVGTSPQLVVVADAPTLVLTRNIVLDAEGATLEFAAAAGLPESLLVRLAVGDGELVAVPTPTWTITEFGRLRLRVPLSLSEASSGTLVLVTVSLGDTTVTQFRYTDARRPTGGAVELCGAPSVLPVPLGSTEVQLCCHWHDFVGDLVTGFEVTF